MRLLVGLLFCHGLAAQWIPVHIKDFGYPQLALQAMVSGNVRLRVYLDHTGAVSKAEGLSGHPLLIEAAIAGISRWKFSDPCGEPEKRLQPIDVVVSFRLQGKTRAAPRAIFEYEHPYRVTITSETPLWTP